MKYIVANWKMHLGIRESAALAKQVLAMVEGQEVAVQIVLCPSFTALQEVHRLLTNTPVALGAQDVGPAPAGAYTGAVGTAQLADVGVEFVIVGHSERRQHFGETDEMIGVKLQAILDAGMTPVLCVGDDALGELRRALAGVTAPRQAQVCVAYEPVGAIGTGKPAGVEECVTILGDLRAALMECTQLPKQQVHMLYGGSVDAMDAQAFLREEEIDGVLVGGASLTFEEFSKVVQAA